MIEEGLAIITAICWWLLCSTYGVYSIVANIESITDIVIGAAIYIAMMTVPLIISVGLGVGE
tara:strand:+ start:324 stop:509 length:186 start_codon:yes stop_codon:yes gene_type:complete